MELLLWIGLVLLAQGITWALLRRRKRYAQGGIVRPLLPNHEIGEYLHVDVTKQMQQLAAASAARAARGGLTLGPLPNPRVDLNRGGITLYDRNGFALVHLPADGKDPVTFNPPRSTT